MNTTPDSDKNRSVWIIGSSNVDLIMKMARLPEVGETITNATFLQTFGGKGANSAVACARADAPTRFVNAIGDDPYADALAQSLADAGVDTTHLARIAGVPSGHALVMIGQEGKNYLSVAPGANHHMTPALIDSLADDLATAGRILLQNEIPAATNHRAIEVAARHGIPVAWNYAPFIEDTLEPLRHVETLIVNDHEAAGLARLADITATDPAPLASALLTLGPARVILTLGGDGVVAATRDRTTTLPAFPVAVVDTTGAGDTFCGALAAALAEDLPEPDALRLASAAAALSVTRLGAQPSSPTRHEIDSFLARHPAR